VDIRVRMCEFMDFGRRAIVWHLYSLEWLGRDRSAVRLLLLILQHRESLVSCTPNRTAVNRQKQFMRR